jgi:hypothetical protein
MKRKQTADEDPLDREIDFSKARPNPYFLAYHSPRTVRVLEPDLAEIFPDNKAVNAALRSIADAAQQTVRKGVSARRVAAPKTRKKAGQ